LGDDIRVTIIATGFKTTQEQIDFEEQNIVKRVLDEEIKPISAPVISPTRRYTPPANNGEPGSDEPYLKKAPVAVTPENVVEQPSLFNNEAKEEEAAKSVNLNVNASMAEKPKMVVHVLDDEEEGDAQKATPANNYQHNVVSPEEQQRLSNERINKIRELTLKLKTPSGINDIENVPAYMRRNIKLENVSHSSESSVSKYSLTEEQDEMGNKRVEIRSNNSFLHDNVD
jgi:cell division protein FtsZ